MFAKQAERFHGSCVMIARQGSENTVEPVSTGFLCSSMGHIVTTSHGITVTDKVVAILPPPFGEHVALTSNKVETHELHLVSFDPLHDLALFKFGHSTASRFDESYLSGGERVDVGTAVVYIGYPYSKRGHHVPKVGLSVISSKFRNDEGVDLFSIDALVHEGSSGGPVIDVLTGKIIAVVKGHFDPMNGHVGISIGGMAIAPPSTIASAIPVRYVSELVASSGRMK